MKDALGSVQTVVVFGGTSEIALATVRALGDRLRRIVLAGRSIDRLEKAAADLRTQGGATVEVMSFEATDVASLPGRVEHAFALAGDVDIVLVAAGILGDQSAQERDFDQALEVLQTNFVGAGSVALLAAQRLRAQGHGTLVLLSSVAGERPRRSNFIYGASKSGVDALVRGLQEMLVGSGAGAMVVRPGFVHTKMTEGRQAPPMSTTSEAVADAIVKGLRTGKEVIWVPGALRLVMAVVRLLPAPIFRRVGF